MNRQIIVSLGLVIHENQVLLTQRTGIPDKWELPGGKIEFGESPSQAAIREVKEETGYDVIDVAMVPFTYSIVKRENLQIILLCFECIKTDGEITYSDKRISKIGWFSIDDLPSVNIIDGSKDFISSWVIEK